MISFIAKLLKALNVNTNPGEIAHGIACGFLLGLMPKSSLLWYLIFIFVLFIKINKPAYLIMIVLGSSVAVLLDPLFDSVGYAVLTVPSLYGFYARLIDIPFVYFTRFNNTVVMGSLVCGIILYVPVYVIARILVKLWRRYGVPAMRHSKIIKIVNQVPILSKIAHEVGERV
ncbi:MAG: TIGR03546 family protein [Treponema sp.]|nr:TIGR03546 family protein [Treponema sp.]